MAKFTVEWIGERPEGHWRIVCQCGTEWAAKDYYLLPLMTLHTEKC